MRIPSSPTVAVLLLLPAIQSCGTRPPSDYRCGFAAMAGLSLVLEQFARPDATLGTSPANLPAALPVRMVLGPALRSVVGRTDTTIIVGVEGTLPPEPKPGFGVLIVSPEGLADGVLLYEGAPVQGAPRLGTVNVGGRDLPLLGLRLNLSQFENPACPTFPDSLR